MISTIQWLHVLNCVLQIHTLIHILHLSLIFVSAFDGMKYAITCGKTQAQLLAEISKEVGESADYLDTNRASVQKKDVFDDFTQEERNQMFGVAPATVWEKCTRLL